MDGRPGRSREAGRPHGAAAGGWPLCAKPAPALRIGGSAPVNQPFGCAERPSAPRPLESTRRVAQHDRPRAGGSSDCRQRKHETSAAWAGQPVAAPAPRGGKGRGFGMLFVANQVIARLRRSIPVQNLTTGGLTAHGAKVTTAVFAPTARGSGALVVSSRGATIPPI